MNTFNNNEWYSKFYLYYGQYMDKDKLEQWMSKKGYSWQDAYNKCYEGKVHDVITDPEWTIYDPAYITLKNIKYTIFIFLYDYNARIGEVHEVNDRDMMNLSDEFELGWSEYDDDTGADHISLVIESELLSLLDTNLVKIYWSPILPKDRIRSSLISVLNKDNGNIGEYYYSISMEMARDMKEENDRLHELNPFTTLASFSKRYMDILYDYTHTDGIKITKEYYENYYRNIMVNNQISRLDKFTYITGKNCNDQLMKAIKTQKDADYIFFIPKDRTCNPSNIKCKRCYDNKLYTINQHDQYYVIISKRDSWDFEYMIYLIRKWYHECRFISGDSYDG